MIRNAFHDIWSLKVRIERLRARQLLLSEQQAAFMRERESINDCRRRLMTENILLMLENDQLKERYEHERKRLSAFLASN